MDIGAGGHEYIVSGWSELPLASGPIGKVEGGAAVSDVGSYLGSDPRQACVPWPVRGLRVAIGAGPGDGGAYIARHAEFGVDGAGGDGRLIAMERDQRSGGDEQQKKGNRADGFLHSASMMKGMKE